MQSSIWLIFIISVGCLYVTYCTESFMLVISFNIHNRPGRQATILILQRRKQKFRGSNLPKRKNPDVNQVVQKPGSLVSFSYSNRALQEV